MVFICLQLKMINHKNHILTYLITTNVLFHKCLCKMIKGVNQDFFLFQICEVGGLAIIYKRIVEGRNCGPQSLLSSRREN